jgi:tripartite-type tricarboxylate transporter receptor subunit TctC
MRTRLLALALALLVLCCVDPGPAVAQSFYKGKTVRILVGSSAGGGFDTYARVLARHLGRNIPGHPTIVVENMPGAGGLIVANHLYKVAQPDGLTLAHFVGSILLGQVLGQAGMEFDARRFEYLGAATKEDVVCAMTKASGITSLEKWMASKTPVKLGGVGPGAPPDNTIKILKATLGLPAQLVAGYKGTAEIRLAAEGGELAGSCWAWDSMKVSWRRALDTGDVGVVLQVTSKVAAELPGVPQAITFAKTDEARRLIEVGAHHAAAYGRPIVFPPGTPKDRVQTLRAALQTTFKDKDFLAETEKARLPIEPITGEELEKMIAELFTLEPALLARLKEILYN